LRFVLGIAIGGTLHRRLVSRCTPIRVGVRDVVVARRAVFVQTTSQRSHRLTIACNTHPDGVSWRFVSEHRTTSATAVALTITVMVADDPGPAPDRAGHRSKEEWMHPKPVSFAAITTLGTLGMLALVAALGQGTAVAAPKGDGKAPAGKAPAGKSTDLEFEPDNAVSTPPSKTLERAIKLYDKKDFFSASIELKKVLDGESGDDARNKQRGEFFMGKTLYQMGFYAGSLAYFDKIVHAGDAHTYHGATLKWLAALSRVLPETSGILEKIGGYDTAALADPSLATVHDELLFLLGRHYYRRGGDGDFDKAIALFRQVPRNSEFFIKAKFFEGVTYVRKYEGKPAVDAFKDILIIGEERPQQYRLDDIENYRELAQLQMARVFYSTQQFDTSIKYFEKLDQSSFDWAESLFEASWAYFMKTLNSKALGNIHTLNAPYFENQFFPESVLLKSVIYFKYCLYDQAEEAVADFNEKYTPLTKNLTDLVAKYDDNAEFYEYVKKVKAAKAGLDPVTQRLVMSVLDDKTLLKTFAWVDELNHELEMLQKSDKAWQTT
jgi:hypothetical protein